MWLTCMYRGSHQKLVLGSAGNPWQLLPQWTAALLADWQTYTRLCCKKNTFRGSVTHSSNGWTNKVLTQQVKIVFLQIRILNNLMSYNTSKKLIKIFVPHFQQLNYFISYIHLLRNIDGAWQLDSHLIWNELKHFTSEWSI